MHGHLIAKIAISKAGCQIWRRYACAGRVWSISTICRTFGFSAPLSSWVWAYSTPTWNSVISTMNNHFSRLTSQSYLRDFNLQLNCLSTVVWNLWDDQEQQVFESMDNMISIGKIINKIAKNRWLSAERKWKFGEHAQTKSFIIVLME